jgi:hypothetical protein
MSITFQINFKIIKNIEFREQSRLQRERERIIKYARLRVEQLMHSPHVRGAQRRSAGFSIGHYE